MTRKTHGFQPIRPFWLITFADLTTLILALFVLVFSMSSTDTAILQDIRTGMDNRRGFQIKNKSGEIPDKVRLAAALLADTENLRQQEIQIKELLFPSEILPPGTDKGTINQLLHIMAQEDSILFSLDNSLLFLPGGSELKPGGQALLSALAPLPKILPGAINISGHEERTSGRGGQDMYQASARRALAALGVFLSQGNLPSRFSISAYGPDHAPSVPPGMETEKIFQAGRLEILWSQPAAAEPRRNHGPGR